MKKDKQDKLYATAIVVFLFVFLMFSMMAANNAIQFALT